MSGNRMDAPYLEIAQVPWLGELNSRLRQSRDDAKLSFKIERYLEQPLHAMSAAANALISLCEAQQTVVLRYSGREREPKSIQAFQLEDGDQYAMAFAVDRYLEAARRAQNAVWVYLSRVFRTAVPASLSDIVKNIEKSKLQLPFEVARLITQYWGASGKKLKDYRDLSQHHAVVSSDGRVTFLPDGRELIFLVLPNNPEVKSPTDLSYLPGIHAFPYLLDSYCKLLAFWCGVARELLNHTKETELKRWGHEFKGGFGGKPEGHAAPTVKRIMDDTDCIRSHYEKDN